MRRKTTEEFKKELKDYYGDKFILVSPIYVNDYTKLLFECKYCHELFWMKPRKIIQNIKNKSGKILCPRCCK